MIALEKIKALSATALALLALSMSFASYAQSSMPEPTATGEEISESGIRNYFMQAEGFFTILGDAPERSFLGGTLGYSVKGGLRFSQWGFFLHIENNRLFTKELERNIEKGTLNIGLGAEYNYLNNRVYSSMTMGASTLLFDTMLHEAGRTGIFWLIKPIGFRYEIGDLFCILFDPLSFAVVAPVLGGYEMVIKEYRTSLAFEVRL